MKIKKYNDFEVNESVSNDDTQIKIEFNVPKKAFDMIVEKAKEIGMEDKLNEVGELNLVTEVMEFFVYLLVGGSSHSYMDEFYHWFENESGYEIIEESIEKLLEK
jgi:hypothetical protein